MGGKAKILFRLSFLLIILFAGISLLLNIRKGVTVLGVEGNLEPDKPNQDKTVLPSTSQQVITADTGYELASVTIEGVTSAIDSNIVPENIREGTMVLGVEGTMKPKSPDMLQARVDAGDGKYLFYQYAGNSLDFAKDLDISNVEDMTSAFAYGKAKDYSAIENWDWSNVKIAQTMFASCTFTEAPNIDMSNFENANSVFQQCSSLKSIPQYNLRKAKSLTSFFLNCTQLEEIPLIDISSAENLSMFMQYCTKIKTLPQLNTGNVENFLSFANGASGLEAFTLDTKNATNMTSMFYYCSKIATINMDMRNVTSSGNGSYMFNYCLALANLTLKNIKVPLQIGSGTTWGHLLTVDSLVNTAKELWDYSSGTTTYKLTMGNANLEKIANVYVKLVDITVEMRAEDDLIDNKKPCVVCESTDEGAMLLEEYAVLKNWLFA